MVQRQILDNNCCFFTNDGSFIYISFTQSNFHAIADYLSIIWWAIILGFLVGGIIDYYVPRSYITKFLSARKKRTIIYSVIFGFLASACSHGILAISMELRRKGASVPSVISFLLASPWANLPITICYLGSLVQRPFYSLYVQ